MKVKLAEIHANIAALVPFYNEEGGNATRIYYLVGDTLTDPRSVPWNLKQLARVLTLDLQALREKYAKTLTIKQGLPLPLCQGLVLVPLKLRQTLVESDVASGYVNLCAVNEVKDYTDKQKGVFKSIIHFKGGQELPCIFGRRTVDDRLKMGQIVYEKYLYEHDSKIPSLFLGENSTSDNAVFETNECEDKDNYMGNFYLSFIKKKTIT